MAAYREAPAPPGLPFPRAKLGLFTALAIVLSVVIVVGAVAAIPIAGGVPFLKEGGVGMYLILFFAVICAAAIGALSAFVVRGKVVPAVFVAGMPALPAIAGALFFSRGMQIAIGAVVSASVEGDEVMRILAMGTAEADACLVLGSFVAACACGAATAALLGSAATVVLPTNGPASKGFVVPLVVGALGVVLSIALRLGARSLLGTIPLVAPSLILVTVLSTAAAKRAPMVRRWHDAREATGWIGAVSAAAVLGAAGVVLVDLAALYAAERLGLSAMAGDALDPSQRARILAETVSEVRTAKTFAVVDGVFAFVIVTSALLPAFGRGPDGAARTPASASFFVAVGVMALSMLAVGGMRAAAMSAVTARAERLLRNMPEFDLPMVADVNGFERGDDGGPVLRLRNDGTIPAPPLFASYQRNIVLVADRGVRWAAVEIAIHATIAKRIDETSEGDARARAKPPIPTLSIRLEPKAKPDLSSLGAYEVFLAGAAAPLLLVSLEGAPETAAGTTKRVTLEQTDDMQTVVDKLVAAYAGASSQSRPRLVVPAVKGMHW